MITNVAIWDLAFDDTTEPGTFYITHPELTPDDSDFYTPIWFDPSTGVDVETQVENLYRWLQSVAPDGLIVNTDEPCTITWEVRFHRSPVTETQIERIIPVTIDEPDEDAEPDVAVYVRSRDHDVQVARLCRLLNWIAQDGVIADRE